MWRFILNLHIYYAVSISTFLDCSPGPAHRSFSSIKLTPRQDPLFAHRISLPTRSSVLKALQTRSASVFAVSQVGPIPQVFPEKAQPFRTRVIDSARSCRSQDILHLYPLIDAIHCTTCFIWIFLLHWISNLTLNLQSIYSVTNPSVPVPKVVTLRLVIQTRLLPPQVL
jgi:hypothetical protein